MTDETLDGVQVLVDALKAQGVKFIFGIVGIPVVEIAVIAQQCGIQYIGMRNEQAACYAAQAIGYLTGRPGVCLVVSGPGVLHGIGGLANAKENCWPFLLLGGASDTDQQNMGAFQECSQVEACRPFCKFSASVASVSNIPYLIHQAFKFSMYGRPGPVYLDLPGNLLRESVAAEEIIPCSSVPPPPPSLSCPESILKCLETLKKAQRPLIIIGKGAAYARAENQIRQFVQTSAIPFLPTPMGKGVVADDDPLCVSAARSFVLREADVILLLGARLNWMLHFGRPPRFKADVKFIQVDICPEEFHSSVPSYLGLSGDVTSVVRQLNEKLESPIVQCSSSWLESIKQTMDKNLQQSLILSNDMSVPLNYYATFTVIRNTLPPNCLFVSEGANTMDIGRAYLINRSARHRLDAGTFGTMGVGLGFAIAASLWSREYAPHTKVVCVEGDSAFGFSGMEVETICRYRLPILIIIVNNNGIYGGLDESLFNELTSESEDRGLVLPPTTLCPTARYEQMATMFGCRGYACETDEQLRLAIEQSFKDDGPSIINVRVNPTAQRKAQDFDWLTRSKL